MNSDIKEDEFSLPAVIKPFIINREIVNSIS
jgi:hypothetical protein